MVWKSTIIFYSKLHCILNERFMVVYFRYWHFKNPHFYPSSCGSRARQHIILNLYYCALLSLPIFYFYLFISFFMYDVWCTTNVCHSIIYIYDYHPGILFMRFFSSSYIYYYRKDIFELENVWFILEKYMLFKGYRAKEL